jgi:N-acetylmuramoyl-L-alanine amidase
MRVQIRQTILARFIAVIFACGLSAGATHTVKKSETFYSISRKFNVPVKSLMEANGMKDPRDLMLGQKITIPSKSATSGKVAAPPPPRAKSLRVIIDAGHGGRDRGAVWGGVRATP